MQIALLGKYKLTREGKEFVYIDSFYNIELAIQSLKLTYSESTIDFNVTKKDGIYPCEWDVIIIKRNFNQVQRLLYTVKEIFVKANPDHL